VTSASIPLCEVMCRCVYGLGQLSGGMSEPLRTPMWSCLGSNHAACPKKQVQLQQVSKDTGERPVISVVNPGLHLPIVKQVIALQMCSPGDCS